MYAFAHATLDDEAVNLAAISCGIKVLAFIRGSYGFKCLPRFLNDKCQTSPKT